MNPELSAAARNPGLMGVAVSSVIVLACGALLFVQAVVAVLVSRR